jgi:hypothetical protein
MCREHRHRDQAGVTMNAEQQPHELHLDDEHARTDDGGARTPHRHLVARLTAVPQIASRTRRQQRDADDDETSPAGFVSRTVMGARASSTPARAAFSSLTSFATTIAISRALNYVRERRRRFPRLRSLARHLSSGPHQSAVRVHHFLPGIAIAYATATTAILTHRSGFWLGLPFGAGVALTLDELPLLLGQDNPYWGHERLSLIQATTATVGATALAARFYRHAAQSSNDRPSAHTA